METINTKSQYIFFLFLFWGIFLILFFIFKPFLNPLVLSLSLAIVFYPLYQRLLKVVRGRETIAAFLTVIIIFASVGIPLLVIGGMLFNEARGLYVSLISQDMGSGFTTEITAVIQRYVNFISPTTTVDLSEYAKYTLGWAVNNLNSFFSSFFHIALFFLIMIFSLFYLLKDGKRLRETYMKFSPLSNVHDETILIRIAGAISTVIKGSLIIACLQGILAGFGTWMAGVPNPMIWGVCAAIASLIPGVGTPLVIIPAIGYLFFVGHIPQAIGLLIWEIAIVSTVDNFLSPHLIERGLKIHPFFILISILGGIMFFGPVGFILGPVALAFFFALIDIYPRIAHII